MRYRAFISYSHEDKVWAARLQRHLEGYTVPKQLVGSLGAYGIVPASIGSVFMDRSDLSVSHDLSATLVEALDSSEFLVVLCSPSSMHSSWVDMEIRHFVRRNGLERVLAVIVRGPAGIGSSLESFVPPALLREVHPNGGPGSRGRMMLIPDARSTGDGRAGATLKLLAALVGVEFDILKQRVQQRRRRRLVLVTSGIAAAGLLILVLIGEMARQTGRANQAQTAADREHRANVGLKGKWFTGDTEPTAMIEAIVMGDLDAVQLAVGRGGADEPWGPERFTPLMIACQVGGAEIVEVLLAAGASLLVFDREGMAPIHHAAHSNHSELFDVFARYGADLNQQTSGSVWMGQRPIDVAAIQGNTDVIQKLIDLDVPIEVLGALGDRNDSSMAVANAFGAEDAGCAYISALDWAAASGRERAVQMLINAGARTDLVDLLGRTMWEAALECDQARCAALIADAAGVDTE